MASSPSRSASKMYGNAVIMLPAPRIGALSDDARLTSEVCLSRTSGLFENVQRGYMKTKIGTEIAHVTRDSDTTFNVKSQRSTCRGRGHIVAASRTACYTLRLIQSIPNLPAW